MVSSEGRIAYLEEKLRIMEERCAYLWQEKAFAVENLETSITLGSFDISLNRLDEPGPILREILKRAKGTLPFRAAAIYLVGEDSSFSMALCSSPDHREDLEALVNRRIEDGTFAWALRRRKGVMSGPSALEPLHLLHSLTTISRTRGMFAGIIEGRWEDISDYSLSLLSVLFSAAANALESYELYQNLRKLNRNLSERVSQLEDSRVELEGYRNFLEVQVEKRTSDLARANDEMKAEIAERVRMEEDLRSSEEILRLTVENMGEGLWVWDGATGRTDLSPLSVEILCGPSGGAEEDRPLSPSMDAWEEIIHEEDREKFARKKERCFKGEIDRYDGEYRVSRNDGRLRWILERGKIIRRDSEGRPLIIAGTHSDITGRKNLDEYVRHQATHDFVTGLPNRYLFEDRLAQVLTRAKRQEKKAALFFIDLDDFKQVNDRYGHTAGDRVLKDAGRRILSCVREMDTVCRLGGDEFTVILPDIEGEGDAKSVANRVLEAFNEPFNLEESAVFIDLSLGIALFPDHGGGSEELLKNADMAMYKAKSGQGKDFSLPRSPEEAPGDGKNERPAEGG